MQWMLVLSVDLCFGLFYPDISDLYNSFLVSEAGLVILHPLDKNEEVSLEDASELEIDPSAVKWPRKAVIPSTPFDSEDSWFDAPPEEFS